MNDNFSELCTKIALWQKEIFPKSDQASKWNHLAKEVIELQKALESGIGIPEELADCFILLIGISALEGLEVQQIIEDKFDINLKRKWGEPDKNGVVLHIKDGENG